MFIPIIAHAQLEERIREQLSLIRTEKSGANEFGEFWLTVQSLQNAILAQTVQAGCHLMLPYVPLTQLLTLWRERVLLAAIQDMRCCVL
jgi:hypothetical protein